MERENDGLDWSSTEKGNKIKGFIIIIMVIVVIIIKLDSHEVSFFVISCQVVTIWGINMVIFSFSYGTLFLTHVSEDITDSPTFSGDSYLLYFLDFLSSYCYSFKKFLFFVWPPNGVLLHGHRWSSKRRTSNTWCAS